MVYALHALMILVHYLLNVTPCSSYTISNFLAFAVMPRQQLGSREDPLFLIQPVGDHAMGTAFTIIANTSGSASLEVASHPRNDQPTGCHDEYPKSSIRLHHKCMHPIFEFAMAWNMGSACGACACHVLRWDDCAVY